MKEEQLRGLIQELKETADDIKETSEQTSSDITADKLGVGDLRKEVDEKFNRIEMRLKLLEEKFPVNIEHSVKHAAKEGIKQGFDELSKPGRLERLIKRLRKGVKS